MKSIRHIYTKARQSISYISHLYNQLNDFKFYSRRISLEDKILHSTERGISDKKYCDHDIIVSLTTYGKRLDDVCFTIESIMQQTLKANRIVLWLDEQCINKELPAVLKLQQIRGLEIKYTKDIKSYKKLIPSIKEFPDAAIITVDDDAIYDFDLLDRLVSAYISNPKSIYAARTHVMTFYKGGDIMPYEKWRWNCSDSTNPLCNFITGVGGVIYPPKSLAPQVLDEDVFTSLCPSADDVWFTAMALLNGTIIKKIRTRSSLGEDYILNPSVQDISLCNINVGGEALNNKQIKDVFSRYDIYSIIR